jgi:hypothetical protein
VLQDIQKLLATLIILKANEAKFSSSLYSEVLQTLVTAEEVTVLRKLIDQDAHILNKKCRKRFQKLLNTVQASIAECALLQDENQLLSKQNDEVKRRRTTKSIILGKAKVMSYEDIEMAKAKRAAKESAKDDNTAESKRGRKRKSTVSETVKVKEARRSEVEIAEDEIAAGGMEDYCSVFQF